MRKKKKSITLLEIIIVIFLIGLISSVVGYNVKGSLEKGKVFRSTQGAQRLQEMLLLHASLNDLPVESAPANAKKWLVASGLVNKVDDALRDGWGEPYVITVNDKHEIVVSSVKLDLYNRNKK